MTTEARSASFIDDPEFEHVPARDETVQCVTDQWNHPYPPARPFARPLEDLSGPMSETRGICAVCGQEVGIERFAPDSRNRFVFIAHPHTRLRRYFVLSDDELDRLVSMVESEWGSIR
jgi:hypothetical protein